MSSLAVERVDGVPIARVLEDIDAANAAIVRQQLAEALGSDMRRRLVSVGRYALRGVSQPQELFIPEPDWDIPWRG